MPPPTGARGVTKNQLGLYALMLAILASVLAVIPPTAVFAWVLAVPALLLGIMAMKRSTDRHTSIAAILLAALALVISIVAAVGWFAGWFG